MNKIKIKKLLYIALVLLINVNLFSQVTIPYNSPCGNSEFEPAYSDEFNTKDETKWLIMDDFDHWGEPTVFLAKNISVLPSGYLKIDIKREDYVCTDPWKINEWWCKRQWLNLNNPNFHYEYTGGYMKSICPYNSKYGYYEARINFPGTYGLHMAYWTFTSACGPHNNAAEIDIQEPVTAESFKQELQTNIHLCYPDNDPNCNDPDRGNHVSTGYDLLDNFQIYGLLYTASTLKFYVNGVCYRTVTNPGVIDPIRIIFSGGIDEYNLPATNFQSASIYVDYLRVYNFRETPAWSDKTPYLLNPDDDPTNSGKKQIDIMWQLSSGTPNNNTCTINWGLTTSYGNSANINDNGTDHLYKYTIGNLTPNTKYYYSISSPYCSYSGDFITPPSNSATSTKFYASGSKIVNKFGQTSLQNDEVDQQILNEISNDPSSQSFIIQTNGFVTSDNYEYWRDEFFKYTIYGYQLRSKLPIIGSLSKNERITCINTIDDSEIENSSPGIGENFRKYLPFNYVNPYLNSSQDFEYNHSLDYGPVHICLPEIEYKNTSSSDVAMSFIDVDLGNTSKEWKVMSFYYPLKSLNGDNLDVYSTVRQKAISNDVQLVIMGHEDYYAHWVDNGIHFMILGNGGITTNGINDQLIVNDDQLVCASTVPHFAKFNIDGDFMYVDVIQGADYNGYSAGRIIEKFAIPKTRIINNTQTWNTGTYPVVTDFLYVYPGTYLTVNSEVQLLPDKKIQIKQDAVLKLTGQNAKLTSVDAFTENLDLVTKDLSGNITNSYKSILTTQADYWAGIELNSYPHLNQLNFSNQGLLYLLDEATIENAEVGVAAKTITTTGLKGGGIIRATNANFINNLIDIEMYPYSNTYNHPNGQTMYLSDKTKISKCNFITNNNLISSNNTIKHIVLKDVYDVGIFGNTFINNNTNIIDPSQKGVGIWSNDASYNLNQVCYTIPCSNPIVNTFENLYYGIESYNVKCKVIKIRNSLFQNCYRGVYLNNTASTVVTNNDFNIPDYDQSVGGSFPFPYGLYLDGGVGFKVEENHFENIGNLACTHGIIIHNTGPVINEIYKNTFEGLNIGIQPQLINKDVTTTNKGLKLFCNINNNPMYDVWVAGKAEFPSVAGIGIAEAQRISQINSTTGLTNYNPAGNQFSSRTQYFFDYDYSNSDAEPVIYSHEYSTATGNYEPLYISNVTPIYLQQNGTTCPSKVTTGSNISQLYSNANTARIAYNSSKLILDIWKDGGVEDLGEEVETTLPWDAYQQFNDLMNESPYLSDEVLIAFIENPVFTSLMVKLLMIANPQSTRSDAVMQAIYDRIPALPQSYIDEILAEENTISQLELLEGNVAADYHLIRSIEEDIKRVYRTDTINPWAEDSILALVSRQKDLADKYELATIYLQMGLYSEMNSVLTNIPTSFELTDEQTTDHSNFVSIFGIAQDTYENDKYIGDLTENQRTTLETVLNLQRPAVSQMSLALLKRDNPDYIYNELIFQPSESSSRKANPKSNVSDTEFEVLLKVFPNPANDYLTLQYRTSGYQYNKLWFAIKDVSGRTVKQQELKGGDNEELIDISELLSNIYTLILYADDNIIANEKLTILK